MESRKKEAVVLMWIFTREGFLSIVEHDSKSDILLVRSRFGGHIQRIFGDVKVEELEKSDYEFRAEIPKAEVAEVLAKLVKEINYSNFKDELKYSAKSGEIDKVYERRCWATYNAIWGYVSHNKGE